MKWFEGSINEAVATSKSRKAIFVVFVEGKDDTSTAVAEAINAPEVSSRLEQEDFVAIRLESGSEIYRFFAQIYQLVPVPSLFFIGENGTPLEIVAGNVTASGLTAKIDSVLTKAGKTNKNASSHLIDAEQKSTIASSTSDNSDTDVNKGHTSDSAPKVDADETASSSTVEDTPTASSNETKSDVQPEASSNVETETKEPMREESVEKTVEKLIELKRKERIREEEEKEKQRELERRRIGRDVQKMKRKQQDLEIKQAQEERIREKAAEAAAREKVRQQIAQDKLERKQRELAMQQQMEHQQQQTQEQPKPCSPLVTDATVTRIQFKLPSGIPHMGQFEPKSTLRALRSYVVENINLPFRQFTMSTTFPRRDLTNEDDSKTLLELELVPTAVILILPLKNSNVSTSVTSTQDVGILSRFVWFLFAPVVGVYNYLVGYFTGGTRGSAEDDNGGSTEIRDTANNTDGPIIPNVQNVANSAGLFRRYLSNQGGTTIRAEGNIHRLYSGGDDNDENNTWNGNSTQQM